MISIGERVKELRIEKGISTDKLRSDVSMSLDMIRSIEQGRKTPSIETLLKLADYFNCSTDYLLSRTNKKELSLNSGKNLKESSSD